MNRIDEKIRRLMAVSDLGSKYGRKDIQRAEQILHKLAYSGDDPIIWSMTLCIASFTFSDQITAVEPFCTKLKDFCEIAKEEFMSCETDPRYHDDSDPEATVLAHLASEFFNNYRASAQLQYYQGSIG